MPATLTIQAYENTRLISDLELSYLLHKRPRYMARRKERMRNILTEADFAEFDAALFERGHKLVSTKSLTPGANIVCRKGTTRWIVSFRHEPHNLKPDNNPFYPLYTQFAPGSRIMVRQALIGGDGIAYNRGKQWTIDTESWYLGHGKPPVRPCVYPSFAELVADPKLWLVKGWTSLREDRPRDSTTGYFID